MTKRQKKTSPRGAVATLLARQGPNLLETLAEFKFTPSSKPIPKLFHNKTNLFASTLIRLWTPQKEGEVDNFTPHYIPDITQGSLEWKELNLPPNAAAFHRYPAELMQGYFSVGAAQNLGSLTVLNLLMGSKLQSDSLGIVESPKTQALYFTQKLSSFWHDYFNTSDTTNLFDTRSFDEKLEHFTQKATHQCWWDEALNRSIVSGDANEMLRALFLNEMFETALRIHITPTRLLQEIANETLGQDDETAPFCAYFFDKIERFNADFETLLNRGERQERLNYIEQHGRDTYTRYAMTLATFRTREEFPFNDIYLISASASMLVNAMSLNIPDLLTDCSVDVIRFLLLEEKVAFFVYVMNQFDHYWPALARRPEHYAWIVLSCLATALNTQLQSQNMTLALCSNSTSFLQNLLIKSIQFKKQEIAFFLLSQKQDVVHQPIQQSAHLLPEDQQWLDHSFLYFSKHHQNETIVGVLKSMGAQLLVSEQEQEVKQEPTLRIPIPSRRRRHSFFAGPQGTAAAKQEDIIAQSLTEGANVQPT